MFPCSHQHGHPMFVRSRLILALPLLFACGLPGCAVVTVAGAAVSVAATAVSITATAVETTVDVAAAGVDAVIGDDDKSD